LELISIATLAVASAARESDPQRFQPGSYAERLNRAEAQSRVIKWVGTVPAVGVCTFCNRQFKVPLSSMKRVADAQESLRVQFTEHRCKREDAG